MKKQVALMVAFGCIGASAASINYDLLGRKGSKMNSPMVYKNVDYSKMKKEKMQMAPISENQVLAKKASGLKNGAYALKGRFFNRGWTNCENTTNYRCFYNITSHSTTYPDLPLDKGSLFYISSPNNYAAYIEESNEFFKYIPTPDNYNAPNLYTENEFSRVGSEYHFSSDDSFNFNNPVQTSPYGDGQQIEYTSFKNVRDNYSTSDRQNITVWYGLQNSANYGQATIPGGQYEWAVNWVKDWSRVGIYMPLDAKPVKMAKNDEVKYTEVAPLNYWQTPVYETEASKVFKILKNSSKNSDIYIGTAEYPTYSNNIQKDNIYIGLRTKKSYTSSKFYSNEARALDNYIYTNRTVEIVAAGEASTGYFNSVAQAANAITVGAVDPTSGNIAAYTPNKTPKYCLAGFEQCTESSSNYRTGTAKPEINNYSHFYFNEGGNKSDKARKYTTSWNASFTLNPYYDGTGVSAAYTAGMVSDLLATNAFYRRHPEVVKAVLLTSASVKNVPTYPTLLPPRSDTDINHGYPYMHDSRFWVGDINTLKTHINKNGKKEIRFIVDITKFSSKNFTAAISWLSSGDDIANLGKIPQDFDLFVYEGNNIDGINVDSYADVKAYSQSGTNAFEKISFSTNFPYVVFRILLYGEDANSENKDQVVLGFDLMSR